MRARSELAGMDLMALEKGEDEGSKGKDSSSLQILIVGTRLPSLPGSLAAVLPSNQRPRQEEEQV